MRRHPPSHEESLAWAAARARKAMAGEGSREDFYVVMLLHYIRLLESSANKKDIIFWR